ncbi:hypothetical protein BC008_38805 [Mastigocoleus testarum BC008]|uniref:Uncharacterized protein n=1 Tax=Mastigocoleus testarum BC008 TaxID=371196 RepID=A0A0V7ZFI7_9CYAN|nr:hypothetical protein BC008_38805 [Mastigocoleus testarum BC008]
MCWLELCLTKVKINDGKASLALFFTDFLVDYRNGNQLFINFSIFQAFSRSVLLKIYILWVEVFYNNK